jgi:hypothetical protein
MAPASLLRDRIGAARAPALAPGYGRCGAEGFDAAIFIRRIASAADTEGEAENRTSARRTTSSC